MTANKTPASSPIEQMVLRGLTDAQKGLSRTLGTTKRI